MTSQLRPITSNLLTLNNLHLVIKRCPRRLAPPVQRRRLRRRRKWWTLDFCTVVLYLSLMKSIRGDVTSVKNKYGNRSVIGTFRFLLSTYLATVMPSSFSLSSLMDAFTIMLNTSLVDPESCNRPNAIQLQTMHSCRSSTDSTKSQLSMVKYGHFSVKFVGLRGSVVVFQRFFRKHEVRVEPPESSGTRIKGMYISSLFLPTE